MDDIARLIQTSSYETITQPVYTLTAYDELTHLGYHVHIPGSVEVANKTPMYPSTVSAMITHGVSEDVICTMVENCHDFDFHYGGLLYTIATEAAKHDYWTLVGLLKNMDRTGIIELLIKYHVQVAN